jgi:NAD+ synthase
MIFHKDILRIDCEKEVNRICRFIKEQLLAMRREGAVIGISGGIDSAVCAELCVKAVGAERVFGLILPEKESSPVSVEYAEKQAQKMGVPAEIVDITPVLESFSTYEKRDQAIREVFPGYDGARCKSKITLPRDLLERDAMSFFTLTVDDGKGEVKSVRLKKRALNAIVAATDTKQRTRMMYLYYFAEKMNRFVCGTTNRSETVQGFFVKYGDGGVDIEPIAHLYKTQVYALADFLGVIPEIKERVPSPDTYSFEVSDEEFFFRMPYETLDKLLYAWEKQVPVDEVCDVMGLEKKQVRRAFRDFKSKKKATEHLRMLPPSLLD